METPFNRTLALRRSNGTSLIESYRQATQAAGILVGGDPALSKLADLSEKMLMLIERDGQERAQEGREPSYHNRQHIADAVLAMGLFLNEIKTLNFYEKQRLLLVMLVHDLGHRGIANRLSDQSHEEESIHLLCISPLMALPSEDIFFIQECIRGTQSHNIENVSQAHLLNEVDSFHFMRALVNDADIAASFVPELGLELTRQILLERGVLAPNDREVSGAHAAFKSHAHISTLVAREALGLTGKTNP
jgi:hypothetical protein